MKKGEVDGQYYPLLGGSKISLYFTLQSKNTLDRIKNVRVISGWIVNVPSKELDEGRGYRRTFCNLASWEKLSRKT